jgi:hypothetical protein
MCSISRAFCCTLQSTLNSGIAQQKVAFHACDNIRVYLLKLTSTYHTLLYNLATCALYPYSKHTDTLAESLPLWNCSIP